MNTGASGYPPVSNSPDPTRNRKKIAKIHLSILGVPIPTQYSPSLTFPGALLTINHRNGFLAVSSGSSRGPCWASNSCNSYPYPYTLPSSFPGNSDRPVCKCAPATPGRANFSHGFSAATNSFSSLVEGLGAVGGGSGSAKCDFLGLVLFFLSM